MDDSLVVSLVSLGKLLYTYIYTPYMTYNFEGQCYLVFIKMLLVI